MLPRLASLSALACTLFVTACGGGGNESGPPDSITTSQSDIAVMGPVGRCATGKGPTVYVYGGQPPYILYNPWPDGLKLDTTHLQDSGDGVTLTFTGLCMQTLNVQIQDDMGRLGSFTVTNAEGI